MIPPPAALRRALLRWYEINRRDLPWRRSKDFYRVWISEIMLQQTRVEAVIPYYERFLERFPEPGALASAPESDVLTLWSGLGYYSRARNLRRAAKQVIERGTPRTYGDILSLAGVGSYTAAAIASIAFDLPHAAVDGNVLRVISRLTNDGAEIDAPATKRRFAGIAGELLDPERPGDFNQAMMELGAIVCTPKSPGCARCPVVKFCGARAAGTENELPVKLRKQKSREIVLNVVLIRDQGRVFLIQREATEKRMAGFWELPPKELISGMRGRPAARFRHQIVGDRFLVRVWKLLKIAGLPDGRWAAESELATLPLSTIARKAIASVSTPSSQ